MLFARGSWLTGSGIQGRNTGVKAIFGGTAKKPLTTKVSMRHLNEIVRERNQYSRDASEAWQDFITLKGKMDTELSKVSKRNNFLVDELESWKQQVRKSAFLLPENHADRRSSSSNSKHLPNSSPKRPRSSRSRLILISARIAVSPTSSTNRRTMPLG